MLKIAHIVNPFLAKAGSELAIAQTITLETMQVARAYATGMVEISQFTAQYADDRPVVPDTFVFTPDLERSVADLGSFEIPRRLPLIKDILDRLYAASDADYFIYTNIDIALMPHFYAAVAGHIRQGYDAFSITKRVISKKYSTIPDIPLMQAEAGVRHRGHDCFIFRRDAYPHYRLGNTCIGVPGIGFLLLWNLELFGRQYKVFNNEHLTFHLGNDQDWNQPGFDDYTRHNHQELCEFVDFLQAEQGPIDEHHRLYPNLANMKHAIGSKIEFKRNWRLGFKLLVLKVLERLTRAARSMKTR